MTNPKKDKVVKVGVGVMILKNNQVLLAKRKGSHGEGEYAFPGGSLEFGESVADCAKRETLEECGIKIHKIRFLALANYNKKWKDKHYVHIGVIAKWISGEPQVLEPEKSESWGWYELDSLPQPLFKPCIQSVNAYRLGVSQIDI